MDAGVPRGTAARVGGGEVSGRRPGVARRLHQPAHGLEQESRYTLARSRKMDLRTTYLGLPLKNPLIASASPLTQDIDSIRRLEDAGAAAVVLPSIFEEQIRYEMEETERLVEKGTDSN